MTLLSVPVIDLTPYREGTPAGKAAVAEQVVAHYRAASARIVVSGRLCIVVDEERNARVGEAHLPAFRQRLIAHAKAESA